MWHIQFMQTPTSIMVDVDPYVDEVLIREYGTERMTGILKSHYNGDCHRLDMPELAARAEAAAAITDRSERRAAWKAIEDEAWEIARNMNRAQRGGR